MFAASALNERNRRIEGAYKALFGLMTVLLVVPVLIILGVLIAKGGPAVSFEFLFTPPTDQGRQGGRPSTGVSPSRRRHSRR